MSTNPSAFSGVQQAAWLPADNGYVIANGDPWITQGNTALNAGVPVLMKLTARQTVSFTNLCLFLAVVGVGASSGSFAAVYSPAGALLAQSADIGGQLLATGELACALNAPVTVPAGQSVYGWIVATLATTQPQFVRGQANGNVPEIDLAAANFRFANNGSGIVAVPGSVTPASNTQTPQTFWCAGR